MRVQTCFLIAVISITSLISNVVGQSPTSTERAWCHNVIVPQTYRSSVASNYRIRVSEVLANIAITEQVATTTMNISLKNTTQNNETAELLIPVPDGAVIKSFTFQGDSAEPKTDLLVKQKAKSTFDSIVAKLKDPALLEFAGFNLVRTSVFPVPAKGDQKVQIVYEHLLKAEGDRIDYVLPRSGSVVYDTPWKINVKIKSKRPITTVYSPSHQLTTSPTNKQVVTTRVAENATSTPGPFSLSYLLENGAATASLFTYPHATGKGGYFLLLAGMGEANQRDNETIEREITLVIDRSGSMGGKKIEQAKEAALQVIEGLQMGEAFNIVTYSDEVDTFSETAVLKSKETMVKAREYIEAIIARGGTNLYAALQRSLQGEPAEDQLPIVMFLTDGLPTVGETSEAAIRKLVTEQNPHNRRVFSFGVGYDVNAPLLDKMATSTRGFATFVLPTEDVEAKIARVFRGLDGPTLASPEIQIVNANGKSTPKTRKRIRHLLPNSIPDIYSGDQLVLLGQYKGKKPLNFRLVGDQRGEKKSFNFSFDLKKSQSTKNSFVARLWASRRIGQLVDKIRDMGATQAAASIANNVTPADGTLVSATPQLDSQLKELTGEIIELSKEFGILTEYTSFLAEEGIDLSNESVVNALAEVQFKDRAMNCRTGKGAVNQEFNNIAQRAQTCVNIGNGYWTSDMKRASITNVQQCNMGAYYRRKGRWISNLLLDDEKDIKVDRTVEYGTEGFNELVWKLVAEHRNAELALDGDILVDLDGEKVLVKNPNQPETETAKESSTQDEDSESSAQPSTDSNAALFQQLRDKKSAQIQSSTNYKKW